MHLPLLNKDCEGIKMEELQQEPMIIIDNLTKNYPNKQVINDLSLTVYKGELFGFIGRNGAGKSTTIECMIGVRPFEKGTITIDGFDITRLRLNKS